MDRHALRRRAAGAAAAVGLLLVLLGTVSGSPSVDVASANLQSWRIATSGAPWLEDLDVSSLAYHYTEPPLFIGPSVHGHEVVFRSPGVTAAGVPAYVGSGGDPGSFRMLPAGLLAAGLTWVAALLLWSALRPRLGDVGAGAAAGTFALATPVWSVAADGMWPHTLTVLGVSGAAWAASRDRWLLAGVLGGIGVTGRLHLAVVVAVLGLLVGWARRDARVTALVAAGSLPFVALCAVWSRWLYGQWDPAGGYPQVDRYATGAVARGPLETVLNELGLWVSLDRGFLVWTPVVLVLLPALVRSWHGLPDWTRALAVGGVGYTLVQGLMNHFAGGSWLWGYRLTLELLVCVTPALAMAAARAGRAARAALGPVLGLQAGAVALGAVFDSPGLPLEDAWSRNAFAELLVGAPVLVLPWLLCGLLGHVVARALPLAGAAGAPPQDSSAARLPEDATRAPAR